MVVNVLSFALLENWHHSSYNCSLYSVETIPEETDRLNNATDGTKTLAAILSFLDGKLSHPVT